MGRSMLRPYKARGHDSVVPLARIGLFAAENEDLRSGAFLPGGEVELLLGGELVELVAHGIEFETGDFLTRGNPGTDGTFP